MLIVLAIKQAVYHTIRAKFYNVQNAKVRLSAEKRGGEIIFSCSIINPPVPLDNQDIEAKDAQELKQLADRFSYINNYAYDVEGPSRTIINPCWITTINIREITR